jgi:hypothetical protein
MTVREMAAGGVTAGANPAAVVEPVDLAPTGGVANTLDGVDESAAIGQNGRLGSVFDPGVPPGRADEVDSSAGAEVTGRHGPMAGASLAVIASGSDGPVTAAVADVDDFGP